MFKETERIFLLITYRVISLSIIFYNFQCPDEKSKFYGPPVQLPNLVRDQRSIFSQIIHSYFEHWPINVLFFALYTSCVLITVFVLSCIEKRNTWFTKCYFFSFYFWTFHKPWKFQLKINNNQFFLHFLLFAGEWNCWSVMETGRRFGLHLSAS